jgi:hypothetical protein
MNLLENLKKEAISKFPVVREENKKLVEKWSKSGLLEGLKGERATIVARLLENEAAHILKEATTMSNGDVEGFAAVAFPLVRRIFGDLFAEKIVSVQPMNMPYGVIFYLDFVYAGNTASEKMSMYTSGDSVYGGGVVGSGIINGVDVDTNSTGFYDMKNGYSSPFKTQQVDGVANIGAFEAGTALLNQIVEHIWTGTGAHLPLSSTDIIAANVEADVQYDPAVLNDGGIYEYRKYIVQLSAANWALINLSDTMAMNLENFTAANNILGTDVTIMHRLTTLIPTQRRIIFVARTTTANVGQMDVGNGNHNNMYFTLKDNFEAGSTMGTVVGEDWLFEGPSDKTTKYGVPGTAWQEMPELDMKINSTHIQAIPKKLKAKWTPELAQDLAAYHNLDAEVEMTGIMSDHIALEIDREILNDLVKGATAGKRYWNRHPGVFVNSLTGEPLGTPPDFTGPVDKWYETLMILLNDLSAVIHRKTLMGGANFLVCGPETSSILESTNSYRGSMDVDDAKASAGVKRDGSIYKKWDVFIDPYFPRNLILLGRMGKSFLETGYVFSPYVPLQVSMTVPDPEDFTPRKSVMTRYGKKLVRPDMYGLVIIENLVS